MRVLITGATSGIGEELAKTYLKCGHTVIAIGRNKAKLAELNYYAIANNTICEIFSVDVRDFEKLQKICHEIIKLQKLDLVIANAGISAPHDTAIPSFEDFKNIFDTNFLSVHAMLVELIPHMNTNSKIVFISSLAGYVPLATSIAYSSSKAALNFYADGLRNALTPNNISVISIRPGFIDTPLTKKNKFKMPFLMSTENASQIIIKAIERSYKTYDFPLLFSIITKTLAFSPSIIRDFVINRLKKY